MSFSILIEEDIPARHCPSQFRVKAPVTRRPPHRPVREVFPHTVPRFKLFLPSCQPIRRHPDWRITLLPASYQILWTILGSGRGALSSMRLNFSQLIYPSLWRRPSQRRHAFSAYSNAASNAL